MTKTVFTTILFLLIQIMPGLPSIRAGLFNLELRMSNAAEDLYGDCDGSTFYLDKSISSEDAPIGISGIIYSEWKKQFLTSHALSEETFAQRIRIREILSEEDPVNVTWRIEYIFALDWVRSRHYDTVVLAKEAVNQMPDQNKIAHQVRIAIRQTDRLNTPSVVPVSSVNKAFARCSSNMKVDWCSIRFENQTGRLMVWGRSKINDAANICKQSAVDLSTGEVMYCQLTKCRID